MTDSFTRYRKRPQCVAITKALSRHDSLDTPHVLRCTGTASAKHVLCPTHLRAFRRGAAVYTAEGPLTEMPTR